jgi:hypothetical protein
MVENPFCFITGCSTIFFLLIPLTRALWLAGKISQKHPRRILDEF